MPKNFPNPLRACAAVLIGLLLATTSVLPAAEIPSAATILSSPKKYPAMCYGGYRQETRAQAPSVEQVKQDLRILSAMGIRIVRTYNTQQFPLAARTLQAISELKQEQPGFEMYVMLGAWIDCLGAWSEQVDHEQESEANNRAEIEAAVALTKKYPDIVRVIAVGNESMVHWASSYYVRPRIILKWVNFLQQEKTTGEISQDVWITSSDNFASWGGGDAIYHSEDLRRLVRAVDYVSLHTYPFHDTHHNSDYWIRKSDDDAAPVASANAAMKRAVDYAHKQFRETSAWVKSVAADKPLHIGETGWATDDGSLYGANGSQATDEFKQKLYYDGMRQWTEAAGVSCFFFEAFDEPWKDAAHPDGSENHFGLINIDGQAKFALWSQVDAGVFRGLQRDGKAITKTQRGRKQAVLDSVLPVPSSVGLMLGSVNEKRMTGDVVSESVLLVTTAGTPQSATTGSVTHPSSPLKVNVWEGTCGVELREKILVVTPGPGAWWGCGLEIQSDGKGENLTRFRDGKLHFEIRGKTRSPFTIGFQTGLWVKQTQKNNYAEFNGDAKRQTTSDWTKYAIPIAELSRGANLSDVTSLLYVRGENRRDEATIEIRNVFYTQD